MKHNRVPVPLPSIDELRRLFNYDPATGTLMRRSRVDIPPRIDKRFANKPTGYRGAMGYLQVGIGKQLFLAHRIIWKFVHGTEPTHIDHINGNPSDNRLVNLRLATRSQNLCNRSRTKTKLSQLPKGVFRAGKKFSAAITAQGKLYRLGHYNTPEQASVAYQEAALRLHGEFARL
jgi:hypothetical protein